MLLTFTPLLLALAQSGVALPITTEQQNQVREAVRKGQLVPLEQVLADAMRRYPGTLVEVELEHGEYEIEILGADGVIMELEYDAATGRFKSMEVDD